MSRGVVFSVSVSVFALSCATISGLADKEAVECPTDCDGGVPPPRPDASSGGIPDASEVVDTGPPRCDPSTDPDCLALPAGWTLVARKTSLEGGGVLACPTGMGSATIVKELPFPQAAACTCDACNVTANATCSGQVDYRFLTGATCSNDGNPTHYKNPVAGNCHQDLYTGQWEAEMNRFVLPQASGGACSVTPTPHVDRVGFGAVSAVCDDEARCSGGVCDARIEAPFEVCVAHAGSEACPTGFGDRHVVGGEGAELLCGTCQCTVNRGACQGAVHHYTDTACTTGEVIIVANGNCNGPNTEGALFKSYKVVATSNTTCNTGGSAAGTTARMKNPRTVCCRD